MTPPSPFLEVSLTQLHFFFYIVKPQNFNQPASHVLIKTLQFLKKPPPLCVASLENDALENELVIWFFSNTRKEANETKHLPCKRPTQAGENETFPTDITIPPR